MSSRLVSLSLLLAAGCTCAGPRTEIPTAHAHHFASPPALDGALDEWSDAARTEPFVNTMDGSQGAPDASARFGWDAQYLYVAFEIADPFLRSRGTQHDDHLWEEDCAELMIDPDGDGLGYAELQVSPRVEGGAPVTFDTWFDSRRQPQPFGHIDWSSGIEAAVHARGTVNDESGDDGYVVEARIPWTAFAIGPHPIRAAPHPGDTWRIALYALDARAGEPAPQFGVGWSAPLVGDFHVPDRFGRVVFDP